jgi:RimJ/RimL family protein N-acetyltransferase
MHEFPLLETERLMLRCPQEADLDGFAEMMADEEAMRFLGGVKPRTEAWRTLATLAGSCVIRGYTLFSVIDKASGEWLGRIGPWFPEAWPGTEVGWGLKRSAWGKGYAVEAAEASIGFAFDRLGWDEVIHTIAPDNTPSQAVAKRVGSRYLRAGRLPEPISIDLDVWGQSRAEWAARKTSPSSSR